MNEEGGAYAVLGEGPEPRTSCTYNSSVDSVGGTSVGPTIFRERRAVGSDESGQFARAARLSPDESCRTRSGSDRSGRLAPHGAMSGSDRSGLSAPTACVRSTVGSDESGQYARAVRLTPAASCRTGSGSDRSGRLTPHGAVSGSDRSGLSTSESRRPCADGSDRSGRLVPRGTLPGSDRSGHSVYRVASTIQSVRAAEGFSTEVDYPPPDVSKMDVCAEGRGEPTLPTLTVLPARWRQGSRTSHTHRQAHAGPPAPPPPVRGGDDDPDDSDDEATLHRSISILILFHSVINSPVHVVLHTSNTASVALLQRSTNSTLKSLSARRDSSSFCSGADNCR